MNLSQYRLTASEDHLSFEFYSHGPNGKIKKIVRYTKFEGSEVYDLGFGDINESNGAIDDQTVSNNQDRDKILNTIAVSVLHFFRKYPTARIIIVGSTPARTRLYTMQISKYRILLSKFVSVEGLINRTWESFQKNRRYTAILVTARKSYL